jgi:hypothetical protein
MTLYHTLFQEKFSCQRIKKTKAKLRFWSISQILLLWPEHSAFRPLGVGCLRCSPVFRSLAPEFLEFPSLKFFFSALNKADFFVPNCLQTILFYVIIMVLWCYKSGGVSRGLLPQKNQ